MYSIPCVIFAGGKSSRMGRDKSLLPFGNFDTLTQYQFSRLSKLFRTIYISTKDKNKFNFEANYIEDIKTDSIFAPTTGFISIFKHIQVDSFFALSVDSPFVGKDEINKLMQNDSSDVDATVAKTKFGIQAMCGIYHRSLEPKFLDMLQSDKHKLGYLLKSSNTIFVNFEEEIPFLNLNNPDEYKEALTYL